LGSIVNVPVSLPKVSMEQVFALKSGEGDSIHCAPSTQGGRQGDRGRFPDGAFWIFPKPEPEKVPEMPRPPLLGFISNFAFT
jgi:hypothetical protein